MVTVVLAVVEDAGRFLLIEESKARVRGKWNLPGGRVEAGESLHEALAREVLEEADLEVELSELLYMDQLASHAADENRLRFVFRALPRTQAIKLHADEHSLRARWVERAELPLLPLRNSLVSQMIEVATTTRSGLPMANVRLMSLREREHERVEEERLVNP